MVEGCNREYVFAQRGQDKDSWVGKTVQMVFKDVRVEGAPPRKGDFTGHYFVEDVRGYQLPVHASQLQPAKQEDWDKAVKAWDKEKSTKEKGFSGLEVFWNTGGGTRNLG